MVPFNYDQDFENIDFRKNPEKYQVGKGEQGVLLVQPYKNEILPHWRFKTVELATIAAQKIFELFEHYRKENDFVGMDMARKYIQMGYTRARRYANRASGKKYDEDNQLLPFSVDLEKASSAAVFKQYWDIIRADQDYQRRKKAHQKKYG